MSEYMQILIESDESGHDYIFPISLKDQWEVLKKRIENTEEYSDDWYDAIDDFSDVFEQYRLGGAIDAELFVKKEYFDT
ncbi:hypothetical protein ETU10_08635 [Apibacter muscae]|uniref:hypothetical protein n=2 Tax=Apibacter muscae TaxID=2509004 RepID=UPI0011AD8EBA|nr:hypothetical protein [Apibacter muscae]TWP23152.1 hypothetical protein ETU10_08635 [Apibacter muscae]